MPQTPSTQQDNQQSRLFYGWVMLPITTIGLICSAPGQSFGVQPFKELFSESLGLARWEVSTAYMVGTALAALPMTYIGTCMDRFGARRTLMVIVTLMALACLLMSQAQGVFTLFLAFLMLRTFGQGSLTLLNFNTMAMWFHRRLGLVNALMSIGLAGAIATVPAFNNTLINQFGWRWAYALLGLGAWALMFPLLVFAFRNKPEDVGQRTDNDPHPHPDAPPPEPERAFSLRDAMRTRAYWIMLLMIGFWALANTGLVFCMGSVFRTRGLELTAANAQAAQVMFAFGLTLAAMQLPAGVLVDRAPAHRVLVIAGLGMVGVFSLFRFSGGSGAMVYVIGVCQGIAQSLLMAVNAVMWVRYFGRANLGRIRGTVTSTMVGASAAGPLMLDLTHELVGRYEPMITVFALVPLGLAVAAMFATPPRDTETPLAPDVEEPLEEPETAVSETTVTEPGG